MWVCPRFSFFPLGRHWVLIAGEKEKKRRRMFGWHRNIQNHLLFGFLLLCQTSTSGWLVSVAVPLLGRAVDLLDVHLESFHQPTEEMKTVCGGSSSCEIGNNAAPPPTFMASSSSSLNVCEDLLPNICEYVSSGCPPPDQVLKKKLQNAAEKLACRSLMDQLN